MSTVSASTAFADVTGTVIPAEWSYDATSPLVVTLRTYPPDGPLGVWELSRTLLVEAVDARPPRMAGLGGVLLQRGSAQLLLLLPGATLIGCLADAGAFLDETYGVCAPCLCDLVGPEWCPECAATGRMVDAALAAINREEEAA